MTEQEFEVRFDRYEFDAEYFDFVANRCDAWTEGKVLRIMENGDVYEEFKELMMAKVAV